MHDENSELLQLSPEDRNALPDNVRKYISALERKLQSLTQTLDNQDDELRKKRYAYWKR
jgi:hypothetical protein